MFPHIQASFLKQSEDGKHLNIIYFLLKIYF